MRSRTPSTCLRNDWRSHDEAIHTGSRYRGAMEFDVVGGVVMTLDEYKAWLERRISYYDKLRSTSVTHLGFAVANEGLTAFEQALRTFDEVKPCGN